MRGDRASRDTRHNKEYDNLKSSLKKDTNRAKKHTVVFDESANEFFEADYIIVVRDDCVYSDESENEECVGCGTCDRHQEPEALSPPEGYKDMGLFNRDGTLREQAWWDAGDVVLVSERSGTVFTPQHLQLLRRLHRERMLRSSICADCDAHVAFHQPFDMEYGLEEKRMSDAEQELRPVTRPTGKHIAAGEERPRLHSTQQTMPTAGEESATYDSQSRISIDSSPRRQRRGGILKGGRLWKSLDSDKDTNEQNENDVQRSTTTANGEDGLVTPRSVRFVERSKEPEEAKVKSEIYASCRNDTPNHVNKNATTNTHRSETPLILTLQLPRANSAVQQLFNNSRPPPPVIEPPLGTSETLRASDAGVRPKAEDAVVLRVTERNAMRFSLLRNETRKKQQPKQDTTSLSERIRILTCDVEDETEEQRSSPAGTSIEKLSAKSDNTNTGNKNNEKAFENLSTSSVSPTLPLHQQPELADMHQEPQKMQPKSESCRQFLSTLAPLTACVGSTTHSYVPPGDKTSPSSALHLVQKQYNDAPAPDVVAGTPGAMEGDDGLKMFAKEAAWRTERLQQRYSQEVVSSDDEHDDYGFHRRPPVRGIAMKLQLGCSNGIPEHKQLCPSAAQLSPAHAYQRTSFNYSWPYYSEANLNSRPQSRASTSANCCADTSQELYSSQTVSEQTSPVRLARGRRPESPPPIPNNHHLLYVPYTSHYHNQRDYNAPWTTENVRSLSTHYQQPQLQLQILQLQMQQKQQLQQNQKQARSELGTPQLMAQVQSQVQRHHYSHAIQPQNVCPAPVRFRTVPASQLGGGKQMISYSEKVVPPLCQQAPGSLSRPPASHPAPTVNSPTIPSNNPLYYAMNV